MTIEHVEGVFLNTVGERCCIGGSYDGQLHEDFFEVNLLRPRDFVEVFLCQRNSPSNSSFVGYDTKQCP